MRITGYESGNAPRSASIGRRAFLGRSVMAGAALVMARAGSGVGREINGAIRSSFSFLHTYEGMLPEK